MRFSDSEPDINFTPVADWYVIFVKTFEEIRFAERLQDKLNRTKYVVFLPTRERSFREGHEVTLHKVLAFPGYVFVATLRDSGEVFNTIQPLVMADEAAFKLLGNEGEFRCVKVADEEKKFLSRFMNREFNIPAVEMIEDGAKVSIVHGGLFDGFEGRVKKVNKYRQTVDVELELFGSKQIATFAMTVVKRRDAELLGV